MLINGHLDMIVPDGVVSWLLDELGISSGSIGTPLPHELMPKQMYCHR